MGRHVVHRFRVEFDKLKDGDVYESVCGRRYIACAPPTQEECAEITERTKDSPICRKCDREWKAQEAVNADD